MTAEKYRVALDDEYIDDTQVEDEQVHILAQDATATQPTHRYNLRTRRGAINLTNAVVPIPDNLREAMNSPFSSDWKEAMDQ